MTLDKLEIEREDIGKKVYRITEMFFVEKTFRVLAKDEDEAWNKILEQVEIDWDKVKITGFDSLLVIVDHRLICNPDSSMVLDLSIGDSTTLKGRCIGYDDLLEELRLDHVVKIMN